MRYYYKSKEGNGFLNLKSPCLEEGYEEITEEEFNELTKPKVYTPSTEEELAEIKQQNYENRVVELLRVKYSLNQELAILRQRDDKPEEFAAYNAYAEECKATAKAEIKI